MKITFHGTRGSIATPGPETARYGGDTSCVSISGDDPTHLLILDAGSGIRRLGITMGQQVRRIDLFLSHLHLDHIVGLGFFAPLFRQGLVITIAAPPSSTPLLDRLGRYLSPPLFPVRLREVACDLRLEDTKDGRVAYGEFIVSAAAIIHPDNAVGYRIESRGQTMAYLPDHEPALSPAFPTLPAWTSGAAIAEGADLLVHDAQYAPEEYADHIGWGHSSVLQAAAFADLAGARALALFHHDPAHDDGTIDRLAAEARAASDRLQVFAARQGASVRLGEG